MATITRGPRYPASEFSRRGKAIYEEQLREQLEPEHIGRYLAIDIESGEWEIADSEMDAVDQLWARLSDPQPWIMRIGYPALRRFGGYFHRLPE